MTSLEITPDGGFIVAGASTSGISGSKTVIGKAWVIKCDASGNKQWEKGFTSEADGTIIVSHAIVTTADGGYLLKTHPSVIKLNSSGDTVWVRAVVGEAFETIKPTRDGGYIVGSTVTGYRSTADFRATRLDANGNVTWERTWAGAGNDGVRSVLQTTDGGFLLSGTSSLVGGVPTAEEITTSAFLGMMTVKLDRDGNLVYFAAFDGIFIWSMVENAGGEAVMTGTDTTGQHGLVDLMVARYRLQAPFIITPPASLTVTNGTPAATLTVSQANGGFMQWRKNGTPIANATNDSHTISPVSTGDAGTYSVPVTNLLGTATASATLTVIQDTDGDGLPDDWETADGTNPLIADAGADIDGDGFTNLQEYRAGTHPNNAASRLDLAYLPVICDNLVFGFNATSNLTYTVQTTTNIATGPWTRVMDVLAAPTNRVIILTEDPRGQPGRYFRLGTPMSP